MKVRPATAADLDLLVALQDHVHRPHVVREPDRYVPTDPDAVRAWFAAMLSREQVVVLLAGRAGFAVCIEQRREATPFTCPRHVMVVDQIAVAEVRQGQGIGRRLMQAAEELGRALGCTELVLEVRADNLGARGFYRALGYAPRQLRMGKRLGPGQPRPEGAVSDG